MLDFLRQKRRSSVIVVIFAAIILVFIFWGSYSPQGDNASSNYVAEVDGVGISANAYNELYRRQMEYYRNIFKGKVSEDFFDKLDLRKQAVNMLVEKTVILNAAEKEGVKASKAEVQDRIAAIPAFRKDGVFNKDVYFSLLQQNRLSPGEFEQGLREDITIEKMRNNALKDVSVSEAEAKEMYLKENRQISLDYVEVQASKFLGSAAVKDEEISAYYGKNIERFMLPAKINAFYAYMGKEVFAKGIKVTDAELKARYERDMDEFREPRKIKAAHILVSHKDDKDKAKKKAEELLGRIKKGEDFSSLASKYSDDPGSAKKGGDLGYFSIGMMVKPFENAAVALKKGETSGIVETEYGYHIIRVDDIKEEKLTSFNDVRARLQSRIVFERGEAAAREKISSLDAALRAASTVDEFKNAAKKSGAMSAVTGLISETDASSELVKDERLKDAAFVLGANGISGIVDTQGRLYIIKIIERQDEHPAPLQAVKKFIEDVLKREKAVEEAEAAAKGFLDKVKAGGDFAGLAKKEGYKTGKTESFSMAKGSIPGINVSLAENGAIFDLTKTHPYYGMPLTQGESSYVFRLRDSKEAALKGFEDKKAEFMARKLDEKKAAATKVWLEGLKAKASIVVHEELL